jgi:Vam6/Vps39-like protein vacuolar protein sorting-associated protein 39
VDFLANIKKALAIHYLEHLIQDLNDMTPSFHDRLISLYLDEIANPSTPLEQRHQTREKLENFLEESTQYVPERILARLPNSTKSFREMC